MLQPCRLVSVTYLNSAREEKGTLLGQRAFKGTEVRRARLSGLYLDNVYFALKDHLTCDICHC